MVEYDEDAKSLLIEVRNADLDLEEREPREVKVVSDLTFLVENVRDWLEQHGTEVRLPEKGDDAREPCFPDSGLPLDNGQREAVRTALSNPLTYVWGPPGTGKTRHVLAGAVVQMVLAGKKVGIYAPTNNALEQAMRAVLEAAERQGLERRKILRVGRPSPKFARDFGDACEVHGLQEQIARLERQRKNYVVAVNHRRGATVLDSVPMLQHEIENLRDELRRRRKYCELQGSVRKALQLETERLDYSTQRQGDLRRKLAGSFVIRVLSRLKGERATWEKELAELAPEMEGQRDVVRRLRLKVEKLDRIAVALERKIGGRLENIRRTRTESEKLNEILGHLDLLNPEATAIAVDDLAAKTNAYRERTAAIAAEYATLTREEIQQRMQEVDQHIERLKALALEKRVREAAVIAMTLDCHIGRFRDELIPFDHAFLDEAGYAPAVKALTLFRRGLPLTFLGDHRQLGPVCEMDEPALDFPEMVWKKSALFADDLFTAGSPEELNDDWSRMLEPGLRSFAKGHLRRTFRFGQNLAELLAECVYKNLHFVSAVSPAAGLRLTCLNAVPSGRPETKKQNVAEAERIRELLEESSEFGGAGAREWVILTPYRNQVALLGTFLPEAQRHERITTIHKAQGREWDTVILSMVDGLFNAPWFTDSMNLKSDGLHVMNTAITRARKHLIVICDLCFWQNHEERELQLISRLIERASHDGALNLPQKPSAAGQGELGLRIPGELWLG